MQTKPGLDELFERRITYPDVDPQTRLARLVGLDDQKLRLTKILGLLVNPAGLERWAAKHHPGAQLLLEGSDELVPTESFRTGKHRPARLYRYAAD